MILYFIFYEKNNSIHRYIIPELRKKTFKVIDCFFYQFQIYKIITGFKKLKNLNERNMELCLPGFPLNPLKWGHFQGS